MMRRNRVRGGLWAFVYVALRRLLELVVLALRSEAKKEVEALVLHHETPYCDAKGAHWHPVGAENVIPYH